MGCRRYIIKDMRPRLIGSEKINYDSDRLKIRSAKLKFPKGRVVEWEYLDHSDVVLALPIDEEKNVFLVREWRLAWKKEVLQIPGGIYKGKAEKGRIHQVHDELKEELGMDARHIKKLSTFYGAANIKYQPHIYLATDLFTSFKKPDENEFVKVIKMPFMKAYDLFVNEGEMTTSSTLIAFLLAKELVYKKRG